jgi:hypothetical protein
MKRIAEAAITEPALVAFGSTDTPHPAIRIATMPTEPRMPDGTTRGPFGINELHPEIQKAFDDYLDSACIEMREAPNA